MTTRTDAERSDGIVGEVGKNGNGKAPAAERYVELHMRMNLDTGIIDTKVFPQVAITNRHLMYGMLEMMRDVVYRHSLPGELALLEAASRQQLVVAPDGAVPRFPGRG